MKIINLFLIIVLLILVASCNKVSPQDCIDKCIDNELNYFHNCNSSINSSKKIFVNDEVILKFKEVWNLSYYSSDYMPRKEMGLCLKIENISSNTPIIKEAIIPFMNNITCVQIENNFSCPEGYADGRMHTHPCSQCCKLSEKDKGIFIKARENDSDVPFFFGVICNYNSYRIYEHENQIDGYDIRLIN